MSMAPNTDPSLHTAKQKTILEEAQEIIFGDRERTYGSPDQNLQVIGELWTAYLLGTVNKRNKVAVDVNDVCNMMVLLKVARLINTPEHRDSQVDAIGYIALMNRVQHFRKYVVHKEEQVVIQSTK